MDDLKPSPQVRLDADLLLGGDLQEIEGKESQYRLATMLQARNATANTLWDVTCCTLNTFSEVNWRNEVRWFGICPACRR